MLFRGFVEDAEVGVIARLADDVVVNGLAHSTTGLVGVGAVVETTVGRHLEYLWEIVPDVLFLEIIHAEAPYAGGVDNLAAAGQVVHLREGRGVHTGVVRCRNLARAEVETGDKGID